LFKRLCQVDDGFERRRLGLILGGSDESMHNTPMNIESHATWARIAQCLAEASGLWYCAKRGEQVHNGLRNRTNS
jgi:hypothetical protein